MRNAIKLGLVGLFLLFVGGLGWYLQNLQEANDWVRSLGRKPRAADEIVVVQRTTTVLPGLDGAVKVRVGDIKRGRTADIEILGVDAASLAVQNGARAGDRIAFTHDGKNYELEVLRYVDDIGSGDTAAFKLNALAGDAALDAPKPLPAELLAAWEKAGAQAGSLVPQERPDSAKGIVMPGDVGVLGDEVLIFRAGALPAKSGETACFVFKTWQVGVIPNLPNPDQPFGLDLSGTAITDVGLQELRGLKQLQTLSLAGTSVSAAGLNELAGLEQLKTLDLSGTNLRGIAIKAPGALKQLQMLNLSNSQIHSEELKALAGLTQLRTLVLQANLGIGDDGLKELAGLTQLETLNLGATGVYGVGFKHLVGLKQLRTLSLYKSAITNDGLKELAAFDQMKSLYLGETNLVTDAGMKELAKLTQLTSLDLHHNLNVTDEGLKELAALKQLQHLNLEGTNLSDATLKHLSGLTKLQNLHVSGRKVTNAGLRELQKAIPACRILPDPEKKPS